MTLSDPVNPAGLFRRLWRSQKGSVALTFAVALPVMIGATAFATDMGNIYLQRRNLQGATDAAALATARQPSKAGEVARRVLDENGLRDARFSLTFGSYQTDASGARRFVPKAGGETVRVETSNDVPLHFATIFGLSRETVGAQADAARAPIVSLSAGSRLASVNEGIVNSLLGDLLGVKLDLKVADYNALLTTSLPLKPLLSGLAQTLGESPVDAPLGHVLTKPISLSVFLDLLSRQSDAAGDKVAAATLRKMAQQTRASPAKVTLGDALALDPALADKTLGHIGARVSSSISVLGLVNALLDQSRVGAEVHTDLNALGLAKVSLDLLIGDPKRSARSLAVSDTLPRIETDQVRLRVPMEIGDPLSLLKVRLPIEIVLAGGSAEVVGVTCSDKLWEREVKVAVRPGLARASLGRWTKPLAQASVHDRLTPETLVNVTLLLVSIPVQGVANIVAAESTKTVIFRGNEIGSGAMKTVKTGSIVGSLATSLLTESHLTALGLSTGPALDIVADILKPAIAPVDKLLDSLLAALGVRVGEMDVRVDDLVCQQARIVG